MKIYDKELYGTVEKGKRALILYTSTTGFSKMVVDRWEVELREYGFDVDVFRATNIKDYPVIKDYDLLVTGTGIIGGVPERQLLAALGAGNYTNLDILSKPGGTNEPPQWGRGVPLKKAIIFATHSGSHRGPSQVTGALGILRLIVGDLGFQVIGEFACVGYDASRWRSHNTCNGLAKAMNTTHENVWQILEEYFVNPESEMIKALSEEDRALVAKYAGMQQKHDAEYIGEPDHWANKKLASPREKDLVKAEIFMAEIIEDMFIPVEKETINTTHICIA